MLIFNEVRWQSVRFWIWRDNVNQVKGWEGKICLIENKNTEKKD